MTSADGPGDFRGDITAEDGPNDSTDRNTALHEEAVRAAIGRDEIGEVAADCGTDDADDEDAGNPNNSDKECHELHNESGFCSWLVVWHRRTQLFQPNEFDELSAPGMIRTCDQRFRKPLLYPLSYEGKIGFVPCLQALFQA